MLPTYALESAAMAGDPTTAALVWECVVVFVINFI